MTVVTRSFFDDDLNDLFCRLLPITFTSIIYCWMIVLLASFYVLGVNQCIERRAQVQHQPLEWLQKQLDPLVPKLCIQYNLCLVLGLLAYLQKI